MHKPKTAFSAFLFGSYQKYLPFYCYSIRKNYPESAIVLFYHGKVAPEILKLLNDIGNVILYEDFYEEYDFFKQYQFKGGGGLTGLRYLIPSEYFKQYDYVYFGDVDILIMEESISLFDFHQLQCDKLNLPFSNKVRSSKVGENTKRLTGLHFVQVKKYFEKVDPFIQKILNDIEFREEFMKGITRDEMLLYKLNKLAFNFDAVEVMENDRPWHGFHIGLVRGKNSLNRVSLAENSNLSFDEVKEQLKAFLGDKWFKTSLMNVFCEELYRTFRFFELKLPFMLRLKYNYWFLAKKLNRKRKRFLGSIGK